MADFKDLLDKSLSGTVGGVSLTREEEEHWMLGIVNNLAEAIQVGEEQMGALVSSKTTAEANHQRVRVDALKQGYHASRVALVAEPCLGKLLTDIGNELLLESHTGLPDFIVWNVVDTMPDRLIALVAHERLVEILVINLTPLCRCP